MEVFLDKWHFLKSRKFWTMIGAVVTLLVTAANQDPYPIDTVIQGLVAIVLGYMGTVAWEDTASKKAAGAVNAAAMTASQPGASAVAIDANNVNVATTEAKPPTIHPSGLM